MLKTFYVMEMYGGDGASWSTENFTDDELKVVERFLDELAVNATKVLNKGVDIIVILDEDDCEEDES